MHLIPRVGEWRGFFRAESDVALIDAGSAGELLVARVRVLLMAVIAIAPLISMSGVDAVGIQNNLTALAAVLTGLLAAALILRRVGRSEGRRRLALLTSAFDVSLISAT